MKNHVTVAVICFVFCVSLFGIAGTGLADGGVPRGGGVLVVDCLGAGTHTTIQSAIDAAVDGDEVVVQPNTCNPDGRWHENIDFLGKAITLRSTDPASAGVVDATIIDGSGLFIVVTMENGETASTVLDGLTIANGFTTNPTRAAGIHCDGASPTIRRCVIRDNLGTEGSGIRFNNISSFDIDACTFINNEVTNTSTGAAIHAPGMYNGSITSCAFSGHDSGTVLVLGESSFNEIFYSHCDFFDCDIVLESCAFTNNNLKKLITSNHCTIRDVTFEANVTSSAAIEVAYLTIEDSLFSMNSGSFQLVRSELGTNIRNSDFIANTGGLKLVYIRNVENFELIGCNFVDNDLAPSGALTDIRASGLIEDCEFIGNSGVRNVDVLFQFGNGPDVVNRCRFVNNQSSAQGGGLYVNGADAVRNCEFIGNRSGGSGGGCWCGADVVENCLFVGNRAAVTAGGLHYQGKTAYGCTIVGNAAHAYGGAAGGYRTSNCIVYDNRDDFPGSILSQGYGGWTTNCVVGQLAFANWGPIHPRYDRESVINVDPRFVDPGSWDDMGTPGDFTDDVFTPGDYRLLPDSPCIDGGIVPFIPEPGAVDLDGAPRVQSCRVDIGAYEFAHEPSVLGDVNGDDVVDINDLAPFVEKLFAPRGIGVCEADINGDGFVNGLDVQQMIGLILAS